LQDEGTIGVEALQAFRAWVCSPEGPAFNTFHVSGFRYFLHAYFELEMDGS